MIQWELELEEDNDYNDGQLILSMVLENSSAHRQGRLSNNNKITTTTKSNDR